MILNPEIESPIPDDLDTGKKELEYLQREILIWNAKQMYPRKESNCVVDSFTDYDGMVSAIIKARSTLIKMRTQWVNTYFKHK